MNEKMIKIDNIVKRYGSFVALDHLKLEIREGEIFGLLGPNGSGKTTTISCLLALLRYDKGEIDIFGEKMTPDSYELKKNIGIVPQEIAVFDELTVRQNIDYFCGLYINDRKKRKKLVDKAIDFVGLEKYIKMYPKQLSGGLLRRLNIACGIAHEPKIIIMDEPTVAVDPQSRNSILEGIKRLNKNGATIIYATTPGRWPGRSPPRYSPWPPGGRGSPPAGRPSWTSGRWPRRRRATPLPFWLRMVSRAMAVLPVWRSPMMSSRWPRPMGNMASTARRPVSMGVSTGWRSRMPGAGASMGR